jgi:hypothetical protein
LADQIRITGTVIPADYNLSLLRGDTGRWQLKLWTDKEKTQPADLAGATVKAAVRDKGGNHVLPLNCTVIEPNIIDMVLTSIQSRDLPDHGLWEMQLIYPSGDTATVLRGPFSTKPAPVK